MKVATGTGPVQKEGEATGWGDKCCEQREKQGQRGSSRLGLCASQCWNARVVPMIAGGAKTGTVPDLT